MGLLRTDRSRQAQNKRQSVFCEGSKPASTRLPHLLLLEAVATSRTAEQRDLCAWPKGCTEAMAPEHGSSFIPTIQTIITVPQERTGGTWLVSPDAVTLVWPPLAFFDSHPGTCLHWLLTHVCSTKLSVLAHWSASYLSWRVLIPLPSGESSNSLVLGVFWLCVARSYSLFHPLNDSRLRIFNHYLTWKTCSFTEKLMRPTCYLDLSVYSLDTVDEPASWYFPT